MTVKELKEKLKEFKDTDKVCMQQEYNSSGGISELNCIKYSPYEDGIVILDK